MQPGYKVVSPQEDEALANIISQRQLPHGNPAAAKQACEELYFRHAGQLLSFLAARVPKSDLEDVHQGVWQRVWQHLPDKFHGGNFRAWLYQIARNHLIDLGRKRCPEPLAETNELPDIRQAAQAADLLDEERRTALARCLERLTSQEASLVRARLAGESYSEICVRLDMKVEGLHKLFHKAKHQLQTCVERALS
jgi:RNA polymerase sigma factor (sigma-70 family)